MKKRTLIAVLCMALVLAMLTSPFAATSLSTGVHVHQYTYAGTVIVACDYVNPTYHQSTSADVYACACGARITQNLRKNPLEPHNNGSYCTICNHRIQSVPGEIMGVDDEHDC